MKRILPALMAALLLVGCTGREILTGLATIGGAAVAGGTAGQAAAPVVVNLEEDRLDQRVLRGKDLGDRMADYFETGRLPTSTSPDTAHPKFCPMVVADFATIGALDDGGQAMAHSCRIEYHLLKAKAAFEDRNGAAYDEHIDKADTFLAQLTAILDRYKGAPTP